VSGVSRRDAGTIHGFFRALEEEEKGEESEQREGEVPEPAPERTEPGPKGGAGEGG